MSRIDAYCVRLCLFIVLVLFAKAVLAEQRGREGLDIYVIDVEGGGATLIVTPARQAILIDGGWATKGSRDSKRILAAARDAGVDRLEYVIVSHYHPDHVGGVLELSSQIPITEFLDHGLMGQPLPYVLPEQYSEYMEIAKGRRRALHAGEQLALRSAAGGPAPSILVLASAGSTLSKRTGRQNSLCSTNEQRPPDTGENANSIAVLLQFGSFRYLNGADILWNQEAQLVCPTNQIGTVDVYQVDHHGKDTSNNPIFIASIRPQTALINNGSAKGGDLAVYEALRNVLSVSDIYQIHQNLSSSTASNAPIENIANPGVQNGSFGFQVHVMRDGRHYEVINQRTKQVRTYRSD